MNNTGVTCWECRFFDKRAATESGAWIGYCKRHAPNPVYADQFPMVKSNDWCGDFEDVCGDVSSLTYAENPNDE